MKKIYFFCFLLLLTLVGKSQSLTQQWIRDENYGTISGWPVMRIDASHNNDIVVGVPRIDIDSFNSIHAIAFARHDEAGQLLNDTLLNNNSYSDYSLRAFIPDHGNSYYSFLFPGGLHFVKVDTAGVVHFNTQLPRGNLTLCYDDDNHLNTYVLNDSANNRLLFLHEQYNVANTQKSIGLAAVDKTTGAITTADTIYYAGGNLSQAYGADLAMDAAGHIFMYHGNNSQGLEVSRLNNNQFTTVALIDSVGVPENPVSMRIVGSSLFVTYVVGGGYSPTSLRIYHIDAAGNLTLQSSTILPYGAFMKVQGNSCYVFSARQTGTTVEIRKYDGSGVLTTTFPLSQGYIVRDVAVTQRAMYVSLHSDNMYDSRIQMLDPNTGALQQDYSLNNDFSGTYNDGAFDIAAWPSASGAYDEVVLSGNKFWTGVFVVVRARVIKYQFTSPLVIDTQSMQVSAVTAFPNPAEDFIQILGVTSETPTIVSLFASDGRLIRTQQLVLASEKLNVSDLPPGIYFIEMKNREHETISKFIKL